MSFPPLPSDDVKNAVKLEAEAFEQAYLWLEQHMSPSFLESVDAPTRALIARNLLSFSLQDHFTPIYFKHKIIILCTDAPDADLKILKKFSNYVIRYYRAFISNKPPPGEKTGNLRIALLYFQDLSKVEN